jgi:hypothetical protein
VESTHDAVIFRKYVPPPPSEFCTVSPDNATLFVGGVRTFTAHQWNGTVEVPGISVVWSVGGGIGSITSAGLFTATTPGTGLVTATTTHGGKSYVCSANVTVIAGAPPTVTITSPANGTVIVLSSILVRGTSDHATSVEVRAGNAAWTAASGSLLAWRATLDLAPFGFDQPIAIEARAWNGTVESAHDRILVTKRLPLGLTIAHPIDRARVSGILRVDGTATDGSTVRLRLDGGPWTNVAVARGAWNWSIDTVGLFDGEHYLEAKAVRGSEETPVVARRFTVGGGLPPSPIETVPLWPLLIVVVIISSFLGLFVLLERRRKREAGPPPGPRERVQG